MVQDRHALLRGQDGILRRLGTYTKTYFEYSACLSLDVTDLHVTLGILGVYINRGVLDHRLEDHSYTYDLKIDHHVLCTPTQSIQQKQDV
jgi:hypothetical protein